MDPKDSTVVWRLGAKKKTAPQEIVRFKKGGDEKVKDEEMKDEEMKEE